MIKILLSFILYVSILFADTQSGNGPSISINSGEKISDLVGSMDSQEHMNKELHKIKEEVVKDYKNFSVDFTLTYFADDSLDGLGTWGMDGMTTDYLFATLGVNLLKNTWDIRISYTGLLANDIDEGGVAERMTNYTDAKARVYYDSEEVDPSLLDIYIKPIKTSYGDIGFGYRAYTFGYNIEAITNQGIYGFTAVDKLFPNTNITAFMPTTDPVTGLYYPVAYYKSETTRYYITYNIPDMKYVPRGLGFKFEYAKTNRPVAMAPGILVAQPDTTMKNIGFGIKNSENDLQDGFNITNLYITRGKDVSNYYNYNTAQNETFSTGSLKIEYGFAYAIEFENKRMIYAMFEITQSDYDKSPTMNDELKFAIGFIY